MQESAIGLRVSILASGSSGNITLLETESTRLLVDAGLGKRETLARLAAVENDVKKIDGILIRCIRVERVPGVAIDDDVYHRVRIGPITDLDKLNRIRRQLHDAHINAMLMKVPP